MAAAEDTNDTLYVLSIDGGGIRGLSALINLSEILYRIQWRNGLSEKPRPCDVFDLAGGTGTGGLVVLMLFCLEMTIDEAISAYVNIARSVFSKTDEDKRAAELKKAVTNLIKDRMPARIRDRGATKMGMLDQNGPKAFLCATNVATLEFPHLFCTYKSGSDRKDCSMVDAVLATCASPGVFPIVKLVPLDGGLEQSFAGTELRWNNPVRQVEEEAQALFPSKKRLCILSLGTGQENVIALNTPTKLSAVLKNIAKDCELTHQEMGQQFRREHGAKGKYFRLNVEQGLQDVTWEEWEKLGEVQAHTGSYLKGYEVKSKVDELVTMLENSAGVKPPLV